ncbi:carboxypeptidase-like regulatory domain-containing protein [Hymenobacter metallicola]|uniref:Carboxypeptidase regulatory-like domain-containing protein n=1 Tax=Hymenobacter metallicola TaxID=2563114 RepID=A0A4Z0QG46_9BACT|nr:carboxypeptidase-like regulatory domain-containing protein [Hymenobacter metallicola]TGE28997.1 carboxypeptidase regulatory-like domain-containing protein [Hymenobacter metallicola]
MKTSFFFRTLAAFLFAALLFSGVQGSTPTASYGTLTGVLRDAVTHEPIPGTNVVLLNTRGNTLICSTKTRPDGTFRLDKVPYGQYSFRATVLGYQPLQPKLVFSAKQPHVVMGTLSLQPMSSELLALANR